MKFAHAAFAREVMLLVALLTIASALVIGRSSDMQPTEEEKEVSRLTQAHLQMFEDQASASVDCEKESVQGDPACRKIEDTFHSQCDLGIASHYGEVGTIGNMNKYMDPKCKYIEGPAKSVCQQAQGVMVSHMSQNRDENLKNAFPRAGAACQELWGLYVKKAREGKGKAF